MNYRIKDISVEDLVPIMIKWRRDFHKHAEPGWLEFRTASLIADYLEQFGYSLRTGSDVIHHESRMGVPTPELLAEYEAKALAEGANEKWLKRFSGGYTGVVGTIQSKRPGPIIGIRFDMDALNIKESSDKDHFPVENGFVSIRKGVMHACGHDAHMSIGLAVAKYISEHLDELAGTYKLIFQPAEEGVRGAKSMVAAGVLDDVDIFLTSHVGIGVELGTVVSGIDNFLATTKFNARFLGKASHAGGRPEEGRNALLAASSAILNLHSIPRHGKGQSQINVGKLCGGSGRNIIPQSAEMEVETRGETTDINEYMFRKAKMIIKGAAQMYDIDYEIEIVGEAKTSSSSERLKTYIKKSLGDIPCVDTVLDEAPYPIGSEDATYMMNQVIENGGLASYMILGTALAAGHHHEKFDIDEAVLEIGLTSYIGILKGIESLSAGGDGQ
ncbi:amidohydrolase [Sporosarcina highlanderae]|uniref:Amidohydrolase n=1 Tax=Sporosarcina highlanderae TaxID=3035916 RepID=A0ABT8JSJ1_9BACL|nr:amidohydrolase [Sporosarcina highlanderae]MDN4608121.1 amidohydrolase [Sporosarcina highlanderae]